MSVMGIFDKVKGFFKRQMIVENFTLEFPIEVNVKEIHQEFKVDTKDIDEKINELNSILEELMSKTKQEIEVPEKTIRIIDHRFGDLDLPPDLDMDMVKEYVIPV